MLCLISRHSNDTPVELPFLHVHVEVLLPRKGLVGLVEDSERVARVDRERIHKR